MIRSVVTQLDEGDQFVIVDAGSTDATPGILERYADRITHVEVTPLKQAPAIRWGFERYQADLCGYLNTDDLLLPGAVAKVKAFFDTHPEAGAVYSNRAFIDAESRLTRVWHLLRHSNALMGRWDYIPQETCFWRSQAMHIAGGIDPAFDFAMDYDFFCRLMATTTMHHVDDFLAAFRDHDQSKTANLVDSVGAKEVEIVRQRYGYATNGVWRLVGKLLRHTIDIRSAAYLTNKRRAQLVQALSSL